MHLGLVFFLPGFFQPCSQGGVEGGGRTPHQHTVHFHVQPGEAVSLQLGEQVQTIQVPASHDIKQNCFEDIVTDAHRPYCKNVDRKKHGYGTVPGMGCGRAGLPSNLEKTLWLRYGTVWVWAGRGCLCNRKWLFYDVVITTYFCSRSQFMLKFSFVLTVRTQWGVKPIKIQDFGDFPDVGVF
jgi:hypothetical protein